MELNLLPLRYVSKKVLRAVVSILTNKYAERYSGHFYGWCKFFDEIEDKAISLSKKFFNREYVNFQLHSGSQASAAVMLEFLNPGDKIFIFRNRVSWSSHIWLTIKFFQEILPELSLWF